MREYVLLLYCKVSRLVDSLSVVVVHCHTRQSTVAVFHACVFVVVTHTNDKVDSQIEAGVRNYLCMNKGKLNCCTNKR